MKLLYKKPNQPNKQNKTKNLHQGPPLPRPNQPLLLPFPTLTSTFLKAFYKLFVDIPKTF